MTKIETHITVTDDGRISSTIPLPPGEHTVRIEILDRPPRQPARETFDADKLPVLDLGPWPEGLSLRREDMYGDDGR